MTLPKNITDAIDTLLRRACETLTSAYAMPADEYLRCCTEPARAALEAAILAAIQPAPVEPPTDAEVEAWERMRERVQKALDANRSNPMIGTAVCAEEDCLRMVRGWIDEERGAGR